MFSSASVEAVKFWELAIPRRLVEKKPSTTGMAMMAPQSRATAIRGLSCLRPGPSARQNVTMTVAARNKRQSGLPFMVFVSDHASVANVTKHATRNSGQ